MVDINHPTPEPEAPEQTRIPSPEADPLPFAAANSSGSLGRPSPSKNNTDEWSSPAFIKRARTSYGSLFDSEYDPFAEADGTIRGKGRKRTRLSSTWRYESRSPSPEVEDNTTDATPEPEVQQKPAMTDEGCQTDGLEDGDGAEVLVDFHKQATNVGRSSYGEIAAPSRGVVDSGLHDTAGDLPMIQTQPDQNLNIPAPSEGETDSVLHENATDLPMIQIQPSQNIVQLPEQAPHTDAASQKIPSSARLQAVSSDARPPVSPPITNNSGAFLGMVPVQGFGRQVPSIREQMPTLKGEHMQPAVDGEQEDLYGASPSALHGHVGMNELNGFQDSSAGINALDAGSSLGDRLLPEDQYGHWQSATIQLSRDRSPDKPFGDKREDEKQDGFYGENRQLEPNFQNDGFPVPRVEDQHFHQYPDPEEYHSQSMSTSWEHRSGATAYPDLPNTNEELNNDYATQQALHPRAVAMSRSGSARSAAVDLTESSDEEQTDVEDDMDVPYERSINQRDYQRSYVSQEGVLVEENQPFHGRTPLYRSPVNEPWKDGEEESVPYGHTHERYSHNRPRGDEEDSQNSQDEDGSYEQDYDEDEFAEDNDTYRKIPRFDEEEDFDDESSYDEDMEVDNQPYAQRAPLVIDLLSSDDEDDGKSAPKLEPEPASPTRVAKGVPPPPLNEEESKSEEDPDLEYEVHVEQNVLPQSQAHTSEVVTGQEFEEEHGKRLISEAEDSLTVSKQDHRLRDSEDRESVEDDAPDGGDYAKRPSDLDRDTEMAQPEAIPVDSDEKLRLEGVESRIEEVGSGASEKEPLHPKPALQAAKETAQIPDSAEETKLVPLDLERPSNQPSGYIPVLPPSVHAQMFSLDGANDERPNLYPILSKEEADLSPQISSKETSQNAVSVQDQAAQPDNDQLPTPADTQVSLVKESSTISESSFMGKRVLGEYFRSTADVTPTMQLDTDASADDTKANAETETNGAEAVSEETAKTSREESSIGKGEDGGTAKVVIEAHSTRSQAKQQNGSVEPAVQEVQSIEEVVRSSPRRGHRRGKSPSSAAESPQAKLPSTPTMSTTNIHQDRPVSARSDRSLVMVLDEPTTPKGHDASIELAMSAFDSPVKQPHDLRSNQPEMDRKLKLTRALRTELSEFTALKVLRFHFTEKLDVLGVVTTAPPEPQRAKNGRHYQISFNITDQSIAPGSSTPVIEVQVFRPYKDALPIVNVGDGVLLRNFTVVSLKNKGFALQSSDASSWAVFKGDEKEGIEVRGPPVEYGAGEQKQISLLREWYTGLDTTLMNKIRKANGDKGMAGAGQGIGKTP